MYYFWPSVCDIGLTTKLTSSMCMLMHAHNENTNKCKQNWSNPPYPHRARGVNKVRNRFEVLAMNTVLREIVNKATSTITWRAKQQFSHPNQREASCCSLSSKTGRFFVAPSIHFYGPSWIDIDLELLTEIPCFRDFFALFWHQKVCHLSPKKKAKATICRLHILPIAPRSAQSWLEGPWDVVCGCFLIWWYPPKHPKNDRF